MLNFPATKYVTHAISNSSNTGYKDPVRIIYEHVIIDIITHRDVLGVKTTMV